MLTAEDFKVENGRFSLNSKPQFNMTAAILKHILINADTTKIEPEEGTKYSTVADDIAVTENPMLVKYAYVKDGTDGKLKHSVRLQEIGEGREYPPSLISYNRFNQNEADLIINFIQ